MCPPTSSTILGRPSTVVLGYRLEDTRVCALLRRDEVNKPAAALARLRTRTQVVTKPVDADPFLLRLPFPLPLPLPLPVPFLLAAKAVSFAVAFAAALPGTLPAPRLVSPVPAPPAAFAAAFVAPPITTTTTPSPSPGTPGAAGALATVLPTGAPLPPSHQKTREPPTVRRCCCSREPPPPTHSHPNAQPKRTLSSLSSRVGYGGAPQTRNRSVLPREPQRATEAKRPAAKRSHPGADRGVAAGCPLSRWRAPPNGSQHARPQSMAELVWALTAPLRSRRRQVA